MNPLSHAFFSFNGWLVTLVDALDTLWIMDLHDEFYDALPSIAKMSFLTEVVHSQQKQCV